MSALLIGNPAPLPSFSANMIMELAAKIQEPKDVLARYGISAEDFKRLSANPQFKSAYREAKVFWESDANAKERITVKASALVEDSLLDLHAIFTNTTNQSARLDAFKQLMVLAKINAGEAKDLNAGAAGTKIVVNIDMGANRQVQATYDAEYIEQSVDEFGDEE